jgi:NAD(P)-dependent dehydrogenase (short-subunit alcohol dehydrogenase family)
VLQLAQAGVKVAISARSADKLFELEKLHPGLKAYPLDVTDAAAVTRAADAIIADLGPIDLVIMNAGVWRPMGVIDYDGAAAIESMNTNYNGVIQPLSALIPKMIERKAGHIALVASVAGYRGLAQSAAYAPTKAALINLAECLKPDLARFGVKVSIVNPGFVDTPMTRVNTFPMPFMITAPDAASRIISGLKRGRYEIAFPWPTVMTLKLFRLLPNIAYFWLARMMQPLGD